MLGGGRNQGWVFGRRLSFLSPEVAAVKLDDPLPGEPAQPGIERQRPVAEGDKGDGSRFLGNTYPSAPAKGIAQMLGSLSNVRSGCKT